VAKLPVRGQQFVRHTSDDDGRAQRGGAPGVLLEAIWSAANSRIVDLRIMVSGDRVAANTLNEICTLVREWKSVTSNSPQGGTREAAPRPSARGKLGPQHPHRHCERVTRDTEGQQLRKQHCWGQVQPTPPPRHPCLRQPSAVAAAGFLERGPRQLL